jgi:AcrR family transcriptional regulator
MDGESDSISKPPRRPGRPRSSAVHRAILKAALDILLERGFEGLSFEAVASAAGVGRPTIYRRWKHKEDLIAEALESWRPPTPMPDTGSLDGDLELMIDTMQQFWTKRVPVLRMVALMASTFTGSKSVKNRWVRSYFLPRWEGFRAVFSRAVARGELSPSIDLDETCVVVGSILLYRYFAVPSFAAGKKRPPVPDAHAVKRSIDGLIEHLRMR